MSWRNSCFLMSIATAALMAGCGDSSEPKNDDPLPVAEGDIGGSGGTIEVPATHDLAGTKIEIPSGAVTSTQRVTIFLVDEPTPAPTERSAFSDAIRITPETLTFSKPATLSLTRQSTDVDGPAVIYRGASGAWTPVLPTTAQGDTLSAKIERLGTYAAFSGLPPDHGGTAFDAAQGRLGPDPHLGSSFGECAFVQWFWREKTLATPSQSLMDWWPVADQHTAIADSAQAVVSQGSHDYSDPANWSRYLASDAAIATGLQVALRESDAEPQLLGIVHGVDSEIPDAVLVYAVQSTSPLAFDVYDPHAAGDRTTVLTFDGQTLTLGTYGTGLQYALLYEYIPASSGLSQVFDRYNGSGDTTPPARIEDLVATAVSTVSVELTWTAPGDDMHTGSASAYDIRYSTTSPVENPTWWANATMVASPPIPQAAGSIEALTVGGLSACEEYFFGIKASDEVPNEQPECSNTPSATPHCGSCASALAAARSALEDEAYKHRRPGAPSPEFPDDVDFTAAKQQYAAALGLCAPGSSSSREAHFGLALTGLLTLSMDPEINAAFDEWKEFLEEGAPFEVESRAGQPLGIPLLLDESENAVKMPLDLILHSALSWAGTMLYEVEPEVSDVQEVLIDRVLPTAEDVLTHLDAVADDEDFVFWVTGKMQGDLDADPDEVDQTDALLLCAACRLLMAGCHAAVAYDLSIASYDVDGIHAAIDRTTGTMLRLREDGVDHMGAVLEEALAAADRLDEAITALLAETDDQSNDVVKIGPRGPDRADVIEFQNLHLPKIIASMSGPTSYTRDWDNKPGTPDATMTVDLHAFFTDPVVDFKTLSPNYTVETERRSWGDGEDVDIQESMITAPVTISTTMSHYAYVYWGAYNFELEPAWYNYGSDDALVQAISQAFIASPFLESITSSSTWSGDLYSYAYFSGPLEAGTQQVAFTVTGSYGVAEFVVNIPVVVWEADTYEEWASGFPDPTLNGLLPGNSSILTYLQLFDPAGWEDWEKRLELEWTELNWME